MDKKTLQVIKDKIMELKSEYSAKESAWSSQKSEMDKELGREFGIKLKTIEKFGEFIDSLLEEEIEKESVVPVTLAIIKAKCGWTKFCDVTGGNHYALNEFTISDREIFDVKKSHAEKLGLI